jgi:ketosteroid isomerase-like protein
MNDGPGRDNTRSLVYNFLPEDKIMKKLLLLSFIAFIFGNTAFGQKTATVRVEPAKGVRAAFDRLIEGIKQVDAAKVMSVYEKSDRILFFNNNGTATQGWETMKTNRESSYAKTKNVALDITGLRVEMLGPAAAYVTCKWKQSQEYDGKLESASGRMTLVFKLIGKEWKVVHLHTSPDNPAATRPVLDSEREVPPAKP